MTEKRHQETSKQAQETRTRTEGVVLRSDEIWREFSVGHQRFRAAECGILTRIADAIYGSISRGEEAFKRKDLWDSLIVVGNGAKSAVSMTPSYNHLCKNTSSPELLHKLLLRAPHSHRHGR